MTLRRTLLLFWCASAALAADRTDDFVRSEMRRQHIPGVSLAVVKGGRILKAAGYGSANLELRALVTPDTVFQVGSVTKQFTASAIMLLVEEGSLALDGSIGKILDIDMPDSWKAITIRNLLTQTSGITDYPKTPAFDFHHEYTRDEFIHFLVGVPLLFPPGQKASYSNFGYALLALAVEKASGRPFDEFLAERIFKPAGMTSTRCQNPKDLVANRASGYRWNKDRWQNGDAARPNVMAGSGGILSTVLDLAKWDASLYTGSPLRKTTLDQMWTPATFSDGRPVSIGPPLYMGQSSAYGFGWDVGQFRGHRYVSHSGSTDAGFTSEIIRFTNDKLTVAVLMNTKEADPQSVVLGVAGLYDSALLRPQELILQPDPNAKWTDGIKQAIADIAGGSTLSPKLTGGLRADIRPRDRVAADQLLKQSATFGFLACDNLQEAHITTLGSVISRACYYKVKAGARSFVYTFYLTADGLVANYDSMPPN